MTLDHIAAKCTKNKRVFQGSTVTRMILRPIMQTDTRSCNFHLARIRSSSKSGVSGANSKNTGSLVLLGLPCFSHTYTQYFQATCSLRVLTK